MKQDESNDSEAQNTKPQCGLLLVCFTSDDNNGQKANPMNRNLPQELHAKMDRECTWLAEFIQKVL